MRSLRRTALLWMIAVITGVGIAGAGIAYELALREANRFMDSQLRQIALNAGTGLREADVPAFRHDPEDDFVVQIWAADGSLVHAVPAGVPIPRQSGPGFVTIDTLGKRWRVFSSRDAMHAVQVSQQMEVRRELAETAALQAATPLLLIIPIGLFVVSWAMGRALADLESLAARIEHLPADSREPIDLATVPLEAAPLVVAMNRLIERLRQSLAQQRKFLSDAAHELRTPLTALNLQIGNLTSHAGIDDGEARTLRSGALRAATLVDQLLRIARYDAAADMHDRLNVDLRTVVLDAVADHVALAQSRSIDLGVTTADAAPFVGDPRDLGILFGNLIDNALKYTPAGGVVDVAVVRRDGHVVVSVCDTGPGIAPDALPRIFDRFFRAAPLGVEGSGLGLAIARAIAERHCLTLTVTNRTDRTGLRASVRT